MTQTLDELLYEMRLNSSAADALNENFYINKFNQYIATYTQNIKYFSSTAITSDELQNIMNQEQSTLLNYMNLYQEYILSNKT